MSKKLLASILFVLFLNSFICKGNFIQNAISSATGFIFGEFNKQAFNESFIISAEEDKDSLGAIFRASENAAFQRAGDNFPKIFLMKLFLGEENFQNTRIAANTNNANFNALMREKKILDDKYEAGRQIHFFNVWHKKWGPKVKDYFLELYNSPEIKIKNWDYANKTSCLKDDLFNPIKIEKEFDNFFKKETKTPLNPWLIIPGYFLAWEYYKIAGFLISHTMPYSLIIPATIFFLYYNDTSRKFIGDWKIFIEQVVSDPQEKEQGASMFRLDGPYGGTVLNWEANLRDENLEPSWTTRSAFLSFIYGSRDIDSIKMWGEHFIRRLLDFAVGNSYNYIENNYMNPISFSSQDLKRFVSNPSEFKTIYAGLKGLILKIKNKTCELNVDDKTLNNLDLLEFKKYSFELEKLGFNKENSAAIYLLINQLLTFEWPEESIINFIIFLRDYGGEKIDVKNIINMIEALEMYNQNSEEFFAKKISLKRRETSRQSFDLGWYFFLAHCIAGSGALPFAVTFGLAYLYLKSPSFNDLHDLYLQMKSNWSKE